jgi:hypothetical protein
MVCTPPRLFLPTLKISFGNAFRGQGEGMDPTYRRRVRTPSGPRAYRRSRDAFPRQARAAEHHPPCRRSRIQEALRARAAAGTQRVVRLTVQHAFGFDAVNDLTFNLCSASRLQHCMSSNDCLSRGKTPENPLHFIFDRMIAFFRLLSCHLSRGILTL